MFTRQFDRRIRIAATVLICTLLTGGAFGGLALWPANMETGYQPAQPIEFSHALMAGKHQIDCLYCHSNAEKGAHAGIPNVSTCMKCHTEIQTKGPDGELTDKMVKLLAFWESGEAIQWEKVHDLADFVYFDHSRHLTEIADLECVDCHGAVEKMDRVERVHSLKMAWCLDCHTQPPPEGSPPEQLTRAPIHCTTCHR